MSSPGAQPVAPPPNTTLVERTDVHKSCKGVEVLLGIFNEYCEAISAMNALQKRLAKALRDAATMRVTSEVAVNAMNTSAIIFETLADVDTKFNKIADKEYDTVSTEVKKWFKKLAKEEKNHDEKMSNANAKIKQAGQNYEKKSKKKAIDASEEHVRYVNLISILGPEMAQEKYNHALNVTQRHSATLQSVAACLARLADSQWQRSCECVRRFSPIIGSLGQWKALCEGGWPGPIPSDLPDIEAGSSKDEDTLKITQEEKVSGNSAQHTPETRELELPRFNPPGYSSGPPSASTSAQDLHHEHVPPRDPPPLTAPEQQAPQRSFRAVDASSPTTAHRTEAVPPVLAHVDPNTGSVRSLSAFPSPPTHFPIPPIRQTQQSSLSQTVTLPSDLQFPSHTAVAESPVSAHSDLHNSFRTADQNLRENNSSHSPSIQATAARGHSRTSREDQSNTHPTTNIPLSGGPVSDIRRPIPIKSYTSLPTESPEQLRMHFSHRPSSSADLTSPWHHKSRVDEESREFGVIDARRDGAYGKAKSMDPKSPRSLERSDAVTSTGGLVAAMRNRYSYTSGSTSPPPRELPHIPTSVNDLASRYEAAESLSPRLRAISPASRQQSLPAIDTGMRNSKDAYSERMTPLDHKAKEQELLVRERELERRAKEHELLARKQDIEMRTLELEIERERIRLQSLRSESGGGPSSNSKTTADAFSAVRPRERRTSLRHQLQQPSSRLDLRDGGSNPQPKAYGGTTQLTPPPPLSPVKLTVAPTRPQRHHPLPSPRQDQNPMHSSGTDASTGHASNCGCETCSVSKYASVGVPQEHQHRRVVSKPDKPKSWMRRLSMPVGSALGLDSAKRNGGQNQLSGGTGSGTTTFSLGAGVGNTPVGGRGLFLFDGKKNASTTALGGRVVDTNANERTNSGQTRAGGLLPGKKSYDAGATNNESMTNLGVMRR